MAYFLWIWYEFWLTSCFHEHVGAIVARVLLGVALQVLCSYITFPLYALVTQMGSHMKKAIFEGQTAKALKKWQKAARERKKTRKAAGGGGMDVSISGIMSGETTPSQGSSPIHLLHKFKPNSTPTIHDIESVTDSPTTCHSDTDFSELDQPPSSDDHQPTRPNINSNRDVEAHSADFSFVKP